MTMTMVNIMSMSKPCLMTCPTSSPSYSCNYHIHTKKYTTSISPNINTISYYNIHNNKIFYSHQFSFSLSKSTTSFKSTLAQMQTQFSKSGCGCSWMQDNSTYHDTVANKQRRQGPLHSVFRRLLHRSTFKDGEDIPPLVIGFSAPQGCGKTTLVFALEYLFRVTKRKAATISIDDFYLTAEDQAKLTENNPENSLLKFRGNAGSHDLSLSVDTLTAVTKLTKEGMKMKLPRYDKGDRADPSTWPEVEGPLTVILFEGWMLGFKPQPTEAVNTVNPQLEIVNNNLEAYYNAWEKFVKSWIVIKITDPSCVYQWRLQAEIAMRADGKPGMSDEEVMDFVSRYLPAYNAYLPALYAQGPSGSDPEHVLVIEIDEGRMPILGN